MSDAQVMKILEDNVLHRSSLVHVENLYVLFLVTKKTDSSSPKKKKNSGSPTVKM